MINSDGDGCDRFLPLKLELRTKEERKDLFQETFGFKVDAPFLVNKGSYQTNEAGEA
jgi:hypothetical protein